MASRLTYRSRSDFRRSSGTEPWSFFGLFVHKTQLNETPQAQENLN